MAGVGWGRSSLWVNRINTTGLCPANYAAPYVSRSVVAVPYAQVQIAGDANAAVLGCNDTIAQISSLTDAAVNAYQLAIGPTTNALVRILIKNLPPSLEANRDTSSEIQELFRNINHIAAADVGRTGRLPT
jgi:hypothetical protein